jgi:CRISPR/Cas system Type II protein with McrA/HNH and RuvC-like nuclease domain
LVKCHKSHCLLALMSSGQKYKQARKTLSDLQFSSFNEFSPNKFTYTFHESNEQVGSPTISKPPSW